MEIIGWLGSIMLSVCGLPQAWDSFRKKNSDGISWGFILLWLFGEIFALIYAFYIKENPIIFNCALNTIIISVIFYYKWKNFYFKRNYYKLIIKIRQIFNLQKNKKKDPYVIIYKGVPRLMLNKRLILSKNVSKQNLEKIKSLHVKKLEIIEKMENTDDITELRDLASKVETIEFALQEAWGFSKNKDFHRSFELPKCICPKMDNSDYIGKKYRIVTKGCPIHS